MIKLIIFDLSGVCFTVEEHPFLELFAKEQHLPCSAFISAYDDLIVQTETDALSAEELWKRLSLKFHFSYDLSEIIDRMLHLKYPVPEILALVSQLKAKYHTAYFTNYNRAYWAVHEQLFDLAPYFETGIVSYQIQSRKPDPRGFMLLLERFSLKSHEVLFVDDSVKNVAAAQKLGIHAIHFENKLQLRSALEAQGVVVSSPKTSEVNTCL